MSEAKAKAVGTRRRRRESDPGERAIGRTLSIAAEPARVWRALTRPSEIARWWPVVAKLQAKEGKPYRFEWGCGMTAEGRVLESRPARRLALSWTIPQEPDGVCPTRVAFELAHEGRGTRLTLEHSGFAAPTGKRDDYFASHVEGWDVDLDELASLCETGSVGTVLLARGELTSDRVQAFDHTAHRLQGHVVERTEDEVVLELARDGVASRLRLRVDLTFGRSDLVVTETFPASARVDSKAVFARWRRALRGSVKKLVCGTVHS